MNTSESKGTRPNILLVMVDQMAYDCIGALGHSVVKTPHLDQLADRSIRFRTAYCNNPLCAPSRASFFAGRYSHQIRVWDNAAEFSSALPTINHFLRHAGYQTVGAGKMHFVGPDQLHGFHRRLTPDVFPEDFSWNSLWSKGVGYNAGANVSKVKGASVVVWDDQYDFDEHAISESERFLLRESARPDSAPFFLTVSLAHPHPPFHALREEWEAYEGCEIPLPKVPRPSFDHPFDRWTHEQLGTSRWILEDEEVERARRAYYAMVSYIDKGVGRLLTALENAGLQEKTAVIFTSDHGELLGEHGLWFERSYHEESLRVPLLISLPGASSGGRDSSEVCSLVDLSRTIVELGGASSVSRELSRWPGRVLLPELSQERRAAPYALFEYSGKGVLHPMVGVRRGDLKFVHVHQESPLLFDLSEDPQETNNLAFEGNRKGDMQQLAALIPDSWDGERLQREIETSQRDREVIRTLSG